MPDSEEQMTDIQSQPRWEASERVQADDQDCRRRPERGRFLPVGRGHYREKANPPLKYGKGITSRWVGEPPNVPFRVRPETVRKALQEGRPLQIP